MVDYDVNVGEDYFETVSNFSCILADWGTAGGHHSGGTPLYAGPRTWTFEYKDIFSFSRLALELFEKGKSQHLWHNFCAKIFETFF